MGTLCGLFMSRREIEGIDQHVLDRNIGVKIRRLGGSSRGASVFTKLFSRSPLSSSTRKRQLEPLRSSHVLEGSWGSWNVPGSLSDSLSIEIQRAIARTLKPLRLKQGDAAFVEGETGTSMFFVNRGSVSLLVGGQQTAHLRAGQHFGAASLMIDEPRASTVISSTDDCELLEWSREDYCKVNPSLPQLLFCTCHGAIKASGVS